MAGSYNHVVTDSGNLRSNESFVGMIENLGDAYEAVEEMYGMIWWLVFQPEYHRDMTVQERIEDAQTKYKEGLSLAKQINRRGTDGHQP